jgi:predicted tellurium resistance membrane protein TerC
MEFLLDPAVLVALASLVILEIILGVDNVIFIIVLSDRLPEHQRPTARRLGIGMALVSRILLLFSISWIMNLTQPALTIPFVEHTLTWRDLVLLLGGLFLVYKATSEIHDRIEGIDHDEAGKGATASMGLIIAQIMLLDLVFSLDSVITAVGMVADPNSQTALLFWQQLSIMVTAVLAATLVMLLAANPIAEFIGRHPTLKMLAFSFLLLLGMTLLAEGLHFHIPKGYIYAAMAFSILVESLNMMTRRKRAKKRIQPTTSMH